MVINDKDGSVLGSFWGRVKLVILIFSFIGPSFQDEWSTGDAPWWIILVGASWMFGGMLVIRFTTAPEKWTEREFWMANPFREFLLLRSKMNLPFFHFVSINGIAGGLGVFTRALFGVEHGMMFYGLLFFSMGASTWIGLRISDLIRPAKGVNQTGLISSSKGTE